ncbi:MAG: ABC transporter substrate-binding protein [Pseudolabrys sp.]|jgi:NitT/TauT family transport system substrate-binding protein
MLIFNRRTILAAVLAISAGVVPAAAQDKVGVITDAGFLGRHAYFFVAIEKGYYKEANLDVNVLRGQGSAEAVKQVGAGNVTFGFADAASTVLARGNDNVPVRLVAIVYAKPPHAIYALKSSGIRKPKDLEGRQIANPAGGAIPKVFPAYAKVAGIDESKVKWVVASSESLPGLLALGRVDAIGQFTVGEPRLKKDAEGKELVELTYGDAGLDFYSNGIIASENTISTNPDLVQRFVTATIKGLKYALDNPKEAAEIMKKYHRELDADLGAAELVKVRELAVVPNSSLGKIEPKRAQSTIDLVASAFSLKNPVRVEDAFNVKFVK